MDKIRLNLALAMMIARRCRLEGEAAKQAGEPASACPYGADLELERSTWLDGWGKAKVEG